MRGPSFGIKIAMASLVGHYQQFAAKAYCTNRHSRAMSHSLVCSQFRPNFWRPTICAYCYRPNDKHLATDNPHRKGGSLYKRMQDDWEFDRIQRSATVSE